MPRFRCYNQRCLDSARRINGFEFELGDPVCPKCGLDMRTDGAAVIVKLETLHYHLPHPKIDGIGSQKIACDPKRPIHGLMATDQTRHVNCKKCKLTAEYQAQRAIQEPDTVAEEKEREQELHAAALKSSTMPVVDKAPLPVKMPEQPKVAPVKVEPVKTEAVVEKPAGMSPAPKTDKAKVEKPKEEKPKPLGVQVEPPKSATGVVIDESKGCCG